ncbi:MAG: Rnase Y domain-containing protein, partial [Acidimicrobiia bacterium]|nr:Rnase Y domain-containing protein [Acidimicrobiia bacterium]
MEPLWTLVIGVLAVLAGAVVGFLGARSTERRNRGDAVTSAEELLTNSRLEAQRLLARAEEEARAIAETYRDREDATLEHRRIEIHTSQDRLGKREETLEQRASNLAQREQLLIQRESALDDQRGEVDALQEEGRAALERMAGFDAKAAKQELMVQVEDEARREAMVMVRDMEIKAREESDRRARRILTTAIQRLSAEVVTESTVSVVELPSDEMKGRIIGREGRN